MANRNLSPVILLGGLSVNLNHLKSVSLPVPLAVCASASYGGCMLASAERFHHKCRIQMGMYPFHK